MKPCCHRRLLDSDTAPTGTPQNNLHLAVMHAGSAVCPLSLPSQYWKKTGTEERKKKRKRKKRKKNEEEIRKEDENEKEREEEEEEEDDEEETEEEEEETNENAIFASSYFAHDCNSNAGAKDRTC